MIAIAATIMKQEWRVSIVCDNDIHEAVVIEIGEGNSAAHVGCFKTTAGRLGSFYELAIAFVVEEHIGLLVVNFRRGLLDLRIDVPIGDKYVEPAIVIVVEKASAKAQHIMRGPGDSSLIADFSEKSRALVMSEMV